MVGGCHPATTPDPSLPRRGIIFMVSGRASAGGHERLKAEKLYLGYRRRVTTLQGGGARCPLVLEFRRFAEKPESTFGDRNQRRLSGS